MLYSYLKTGLLACVAILGPNVLGAPTACIKGDSGPLYGESGMPQIQDIEQHHLDCAFVSTVISITAHDPDFVKSLIQYEGDYRDVSQVNVTTHRPNTLEPIHQVVTREDVKRGNDTKGDIWWPGALYRAPQNAHTANSFDNVGVPVMSVDEAYQIIAGVGAYYAVPDSPGNLWNLAIQAGNKPMVFQTKPEGCTNLWGLHAYALVGVQTQDNHKEITLVNTNNDVVQISPQDAFPDCDLIWAPREAVGRSK
ncbi:hypothetical protein IAU60_000030 [Kwoniella sp. DSM 27419]